MMVNQHSFRMNCRKKSFVFLIGQCIQVEKEGEENFLLTRFKGFANFNVLILKIGE